MLQNIRILLVGTVLQQNGYFIFFYVINHGRFIFCIYCILLLIVNRIKGRTVVETAMEALTEALIKHYQDANPLLEGIVERK